MKKLIFALLGILLLTGCTNKQEFKDMYEIDSTAITVIDKDEFKTVSKDKGVVFVGDESEESKNLAKIFSKSLCDCDVNKGHFINENDISKDEIKEIIGKDYTIPMILTFKDGKLVGYYDLNTTTDDVSKYVSNMILEIYPSVCNEGC